MSNKNIKDFMEHYEFSDLGDKIDYENPIWKNVYYPSQLKKVRESGLNDEQSNFAFRTLLTRAKLIEDIFEFMGYKNFAEVGTAEGYQSFTMAEFLKSKNIKGEVYTCDIRDVRNKEYEQNYNNINFISGNSKAMSEKIIKDKNKIDLFWIDGSHDSGAVLQDVIRLARVQSDNCIWIFDDFNDRFGCYNELDYLSKFFSNAYKFDLGITGSGKKNSILIIQGSL